MTPNLVPLLYSTHLGLPVDITPASASSESRRLELLDPIVNGLSSYMTRPLIGQIAEMIGIFAISSA
jgi:hypothetical protein